MGESAVLPMQHADHAKRRGLLLGFISVAISSQALPSMHVVVAELDATFVALVHTVLVSVLVFVLLTVTGTLSTGKHPHGHQWWQLVATVMGVMVGFPLFSSLVMHDVPTTYDAVITGLLPLAIAIFAVWFRCERPSPRFRFCVVVGGVLVISFALLQETGTLCRADWLLLATAVIDILGYTADDKLACELGGMRAIAWALVVSLPVLLPIVGALA